MQADIDLLTYSSKSRTDLLAQVQVGATRHLPEAATQHQSRPLCWHPCLPMTSLVQLAMHPHAECTLPGLQDYALS